MILPRFITINPSLEYRYNNALHTHFHTEMCKLVANGSITAATLNIPEVVFDEWKRLIQLEVDIDQQLRANLETKQLDETDQLRDTHITYIFQTVRNEVLSPLAPKQEAAEALMLIVDKYEGLQTEAHDVESTHIIGLIESLRAPKESAYCTTLGLTEIIDLLETINNQYMTLKEKRTTVRTDATLPKSQAVRPQTDNAYNCVCEHIQATHLISTDADIRTEIEALVANMNQFIDETKTTYHQMAAAAKNANKDKEADEG